LLFLFFFSIMFLLALGAQGMRETLEEEREADTQEAEERERGV
jgi:hypothetical protein